VAPAEALYTHSLVSAHKVARRSLLRRVATRRPRARTARARKARAKRSRSRSAGSGSRSRRYSPSGSRSPPSRWRRQSPTSRLLAWSGAGRGRGEAHPLAWWSPEGPTGPHRRPGRRGRRPRRRRGPQRRRRRLRFLPRLRRRGLCPAPRPYPPPRPAPTPQPPGGGDPGLVVYLERLAAPPCPPRRVRRTQRRRPAEAPAVILNSRPASDSASIVLLRRLAASSLRHGRPSARTASAGATQVSRTRTAVMTTQTMAADKPATLRTSDGAKTATSGRRALVRGPRAGPPRRRRRSWPSATQEPRPRGPLLGPAVSLRVARLDDHMGAWRSCRLTRSRVS
jgi:hypothetical protein